MGSRGPQPIQINWDEFDKLVSFQCTQEEIAAFFGISVDTLDRALQRDRDVKLAEVWDKKKALGRVRLRKAQFAIAEGMGPGAATMAIWLGKQILGQTDKIFPDPPAPDKMPAGKRTFEEFCERAGYPRPYAKQVEMTDFIQNTEGPHMLMGARGYGKTDYPTTMGTAYDIYLNGLEARHLIISKSKVRNSAIIEEIKNALLKNDVLLDKSNTNCIRVKGLVGKEHSVEALTIKSSFRGRHPKKITMDDPVTEEDVSEATRTLVKRKYDEAYKLCKNIGIIGQPAHPLDLYAILKDKKIKLMEVPHGSIPELDEDLKAMERAGVDPISIEMSYHLRIPKAGLTIFGELKSLETLPPGETVAWFDPSDGGDYSALSIFRGYGQAMAVKGKAWKKAWYHCLDDLVEVLIENNVKVLAFETNFTGKQPIEQLAGLLAQYGIKVLGKDTKSNKHADIQNAGMLAHLIYLAEDSDKVYTDQVKLYEKGVKYDDCPDSLARGLKWLGFVRR